MSKLLGCITDELAGWIRDQHIFFVATAPLAGDGHVNCSPKGGDCFRVLGPKAVAYLDYTGSGAETVAHVKENGRIVVMFCDFVAKPQIARLHGRARVVLPNDPQYSELAEQFPANPGARSIILVDVDRVSTSCGFAVPKMAFQEARTILDDWATSRGPDGVAEYRAEHNARSIDGLPALE